MVERATTKIEDRGAALRDREIGPTAVSMRGISKSYGATLANDRIDFDLAPAELHALVGENGAGKTTLMNILFGLVPPDAGEIRLNGEPLDLTSPHDALAHGIGMVHQNFMLVPNFTVAENVVLGAAGNRGPLLRRAHIEETVERTAEQFRMKFDPRAEVGQLPVETKQRVEILKLLFRGARTLILDEPTSVLGPAQIEALFDTLGDLRRAECSIIIVTHKLSEVTRIADRVSVLRHGKKVTTADLGDYNEEQLARAMLGHDIGARPRRTVAASAASETPVLRVENLEARGYAGNRALDGVSFELAPGEILGVAGVAGNGQQELVYALAGVTEVAAGRIELSGVDVTGYEPRELKAAGIGVIPDDRQLWGLARDMSVGENLAMPRVMLGLLVSRGIVHVEQHYPEFRQLLEEYDVRPPDPTMRVGALSGGNQQKVVLARELSLRPKVLVAASPTQGLDVGAADFVLRKLLEARASGGAVLLVSSDLDEIKQVADRLLVLYRGRIVFEAESAEAQTSAVASAMAGGDGSMTVATTGPERGQ